MKKVILLFVLIMLCGCGKDNIVSEEYLRSRGVREFCNGYTALKSDNGYVDVYKNGDAGNYEKVFTTNDFYYEIIFTNEDLLLYDGGENGSYVVSYDLNGEHTRRTFNSDERDLDLNQVYGVKDGYIYLKFEDLKNNNKPKYGKIDTKLTLLEIINTENIPQDFDYLRCDNGGLMS